MSARIDTESDSDGSLEPSKPHTAEPTGAFGTIAGVLREKHTAKADPKAHAKKKPQASKTPKVKRTAKNKRHSLQSLKRSKGRMRIPTSSEPSDSCGTESSPESKRIQIAAQIAKRTAKSVPAERASTSSGEQRTESLTSNSDAGGEEAQFPIELPLSSGVFDYVDWAVVHVLADAEKQSLRRYHNGSIEQISIGSMCAGMATEDIALRAIANAVLQHDGLNLSITHAFKAESAAEKLAFLRRRSRGEPKALFFSDNAALQDPCPKTVDGQSVDRPKCTVLLCGIVCTCISGLNTTNPKSERGDGASGRALAGLIASLTAMPLEERPKLVILECVARLGHKRGVDPDSRRGAEFIAGELYKLGYVGQWRKVTPTSFYLPQGRPRVYAMFLKRADFADDSLKAREQDLERGLAIIMRMQGCQCEPLSRVLSRCREPQLKSKPSAQKSSGRMTKWPRQHQEYAEQHNIPLSDRQPSTEFRDALGGLMPERALHAFWLRLVRGKHRGVHWQSGTWVVTLGASLRFMSVRNDVCPCVTPNMTLGVLCNSKFHIADGFTLLAMQGVQNKEIEAFNMQTEDPALLHDLAGNAFTANIVAAFLLAGFVVM